MSSLCLSIVWSIWKLNSNRSVSIAHGHILMLFIFMMLIYYGFEGHFAGRLRIWHYRKKLI